jgi:hypothetical protein
MINTSLIAESFDEQLLKGSVYTRLNGAMVSKTQARKCIEQAYVQGMLDMWDRMRRGEDVSDLFKPEDVFVKIP